MIDDPREKYPCASFYQAVADEYHADYANL